MKFTVLTYNVLYNRAFSLLTPTIEKYRPDILCLQEVETNESNLKKLEISSYKLADFSNSFIKFGKIYGVTTYYNSNKLEFLQSNTFTLPRSFYEVITLLLNLIKGNNTKRTILKTNFAWKATNSEIIVHNVHLVDMTSNSGRIKQIKHTLEDLTVKKKLPEVIAGDFNFLPYSRKNLEVIMEKYGFKEATKNISYTLEYRQDLKSKNYDILQRFLVKFLGKLFSIDRLKVDYIFYKNLKFIESKRIPIEYSDHFPIISTFQI